MNRSRWFSDDVPDAKSNNEQMNHLGRTFSTEQHSLDPDQDYPMDAFDQQLLMGYDREMCGRYDQVHERSSFPSRVTRVSSQVYNQKSLRDDLLDVHQTPIYISSPVFPTSSPTVAALQNRSQTSLRSRHALNSNRSAVLQNSEEGLHTARSYNLPHAGPVIQGILLVPTGRLPDHLRSVFKFELFNAVQSKCFTTAFETDDNMVVSAPTGSGKTVIMELAICRLLLASKARDFKIVYQAPTKSLCNERYRDWAARFGTLGLECAELTGDVEYAHLKSVQSAHIIVTTPEKWDSVTRKWRDNAKLMEMIKIFLVDEVHILNESRGAALEAIVSRMKSAGSGVRFIALSATVPNSDDIATWLGRSPTAQHLPAHREVFDERFRPTTLEKHVVGFNCRPNDFALDSMLTKEIPTLIARHAKRKPVMIFCVTKSSAARTAHALADLWFSTIDHMRLWSGPKRQVRIINQDLQKLASAGVAFHHGGLDPSDRHAVEQGFLQGDINIICSTSTLAVGVNLPCYLVMLKGTSCWSDKGLQEYSSLEVMQMLGRAGRPQFETSACAIILTHSSKVRRYEEMVSGQEILESHLHENLIEHLNAEIGIGTIYDMSSAKRWLASSFLSVRLRRNPDQYRLDDQFHGDDADHLLGQICERDLKLLEAAELVEQRNGFRCTEYGDAMARYYIRYETMLVFLKVPSRPGISEILNILVQAQEFNDIKVRSGEKSMYKQINQANDIRYPIKVDIALPTHKTSLIIQAHLGGVVLDKSNAKHAAQMKQDILMVMNHCSRLIRCIIDIEIYRQDAVGVRHALELCRSIAAEVWDNTPMQLKQIETIGDVTARKLASAGINSVDTLMTTEPHRIEVVLGKSQPFGSTLLKKAAKFPNLHISVKEISRERKGHAVGVEIRLKCDIGHLNESLPAFFNRKGVYVCFLCETSYGKLIDFRRFSAKKLQSGDVILLSASLDKQCTFIRCHIMCDEIAGTNRVAELKLDLPGNWFLAAEESTQQSVTSAPSLIEVPRKVDDFDDSDLVDEDFLAVEPDVVRVEETDDDTDGFASLKQNAAASNHLKRKLSTSTAQDTKTGRFATVSKTYRQPIRLANGNWTCQHTCNDEGKQCRHLCCKEGVKKPKRRVNSSQTNVQKDMNVKNRSCKSDGDVGTNRSKVYDIDEVLRNTLKFRDPAKPYDRPSAKYVSENKHKGPEIEKDRGETNQIYRAGDLGSDEYPSARKIISGPLQDKTDANNKGFGIEQAEIRENAYKFGSFDIDIDDCDWTVNDDTTLGVETRFLAGDTVQWNHLGQNQTQQNLANAKKIDSASAKDRPVPNIRESACINQHTLYSATYRNEVGDDVDDNGFLELDAFPSNARHLALARTELPEESSISRLSEGNQLSTASDAQCRPEGPAIVQENESERKRRLHEEDQKRRWAKFPAWMYEEYGGYVDIVDD